MERNTPSGRSYWELLGAASRALEAGDFSRAERDFEEALDARSQSPGRVFFTEKISDGLSRLLRGSSTGDEAGGRWERRSREFRQSFLAEGDRVVRSAVRLAELRPEDDAEANQPVLETALYLVGRSRLFNEEPASAVPLLKGLFRTAGKTGQPFDVQLIRADIPLNEEDRLWLARRGPEMLDEFVAGGELNPGSPESETWVRTILQLLHPRFFGTTGRLEEERAWLEAVTADHLLDRSVESVELYRAYLKVNPEPGPRADEARVRLLELLGNISGLHFPVPHYDQAMGAMQSAGLAPGSKAADRYQLALERMEYRRPDPEPGTAGAAWASVGPEPDGRLAVVFWWQDQPRDVAFWSGGDDPGDMVRFLEPCLGRIVATDPSVARALESVWEETPAVWTVSDFACAFLEPLLPETGLDESTLLKIGLGESGSWRGGWKADLGHPLLDPPRRSARLESWRSGRAAGALLGGLVWQAVLSRISRSDPSLRAGIGAMARRGDPAADFLYEFLNLDQGLGQSMDASFQPWTLPLLWTRPDPFDWKAGGNAGRTRAGEETEFQPRPDLGHNDLAIVTTGDPAAVLTAWGDGRQKWRVVLDRLDRLAELARVAVSAIGPVTLIPAGGQVHSLTAALGLLEKLLSREGRPAGRVEGLLPLFHWLRLVESHNGDLLDFQQVRPRPTAALALFDRYRELVADLELVAPVLEEGEQADAWAHQFSQRVRKAGLVAGLADGLTLEADRLDSLWGVFEGSDASWVFLDSAAIHWYLLSRQGLGIQELHQLLHTRGRRHLSMLTGAVWMRSELEDLLGTWLGVFGSPYCLALTNLKPPLLRLADGGVVPDAVHLVAEAHAGPVAQVAESIELAGSGTVLLPAWGTHRDLWRAIAGGHLPLGQTGWRFLDPGRATDTALPAQECAGATRLLMVPVLDSLSDTALPLAQEDNPRAWARADQDRAVYLLWRRRLCGLEMASLLAGPWDTVEVLDCRWWRIVEREDEPAAGKDHGGRADAPPWNGEAALALAAPDGCRLFSLPGVGAGKGHAIHPNTMEAVRHWLAGRKLIQPEAPAAASAVPPGEKVVLAQVGVDRVWESLVTPVVRSWEQGAMENWLLLVSEWMPAQGAAVAASGYAPGLSVWMPGPAARRPGPLVWCSASDLDDPEFKIFLRRTPPAAALALDVQDWLPSESGNGQHGATALRALLDIPVRQVVLQTATLDKPWQTFLAHETGAKILVGPETAPAPGEEKDPEAALVGDGPSVEEAPLPPQVVVRRMRRLLERLRPALLAGSHEDGGKAVEPAPGRQLVPVWQLASLAGLPAHQVESSFRLLRWVARFSGDSLSDAGSETGGGGGQASGHGLLIPQRYAELEHALQRLEQQLTVLFPLLLGNRRPGLTTWFDLEFPPAELDPQEMRLLDRLLLASAQDSGADRGLIYSCPRGTLNSNRRLVGARRSGQEVLAGLQQHLVLFRTRLKDVMSTAVETGGGFLVETGLNELRSEEMEFLALGQVLGFWRWTGPVCRGALHLVDLLTVADSPTVNRGTTGWDLLAAGLDQDQGDSFAEAEDGLEDADAPTRSPGRLAVGNLRAMLPGGGKTDELETATRRVADLVQPHGDPGLLVLTGFAGSGRHGALARGLHQGLDAAGMLGEITVFSPDPAAAAQFLDQCGQVGSWAQLPEVRVIGPGQAPPRPVRERGHLADVRDGIVIMLEIQRFPAETRYQIAQLGRGRRLLMTADVTASREPWEHLFLTVPRSSEVFHLLEQRTVSRKVWSEIRAWLPESSGDRIQSLAPGRGSVEAAYAVNLDQCLARMVQDVEAGKFPDRFRLVAPLVGDLEFLAGSLRERGWLAIDETELDRLLLPGPRELLAAAACALEATGVLTRVYAGNLEDQPEPDQQGAPFARACGRILTRLVEGGLRSRWEDWRHSLGQLDPGLCFGDFCADLETRSWLRPVLADPAAAARAARLLEAWAGIPLQDLPRTALWEAWWYTVTSEVPGLGHLPRRPLVTLAVADQVSGIPAPAGVYLCLGTELPRQHLAILSRVTGQVLILYKERSPLISGTAE